VGARNQVDFGVDKLEMLVHLCFSLFNVATISGRDPNSVQCAASNLWASSHQGQKIPFASGNLGLVEEAEILCGHMKRCRVRHRTWISSDIVKLPCALRLPYASARKSRAPEHLNSGSLLPARDNPHLGTPILRAVPPEPKIAAHLAAVSLIGM
jgi:hypothetical protein